MLEIGSRMTTKDTWWIINRDLAKGRWTGTDLQSGNGVDVVCDMHTPPLEWAGRFSGVLCSEVLEHVERPWKFLRAVRSVMQPGARIVVTTLFSFPVHAFPSDYYRYTTEGLSVLMRDAGFSDVAAEYSGEHTMHLNDHGESGFCTRKVPIHVFATGRA